MLTTPFSMMARSRVATPSLSKSRQPVSPLVRGRSITVRLSGNSFLPRESVRKEFFCCRLLPPSAFSTGVSSLEAHSLSTIRVYLPLGTLWGPIRAAARRQAVSAQSFHCRSLRVGEASHQ